MSIVVTHDISYEEDYYLESSARLRGISKIKLLRKIITVVLTDQLILSVLDDVNAKTGGPKLQPGPTDGRPMPPQTNLFDGLNRSVPTRVRGTRIMSSKRTKTRAELRAELAQAAANTAELPTE